MRFTRIPALLISVAHIAVSHGLDFRGDPTPRFVFSSVDDSSDSHYDFGLQMGRALGGSIRGANKIAAGSSVRFLTFVACLAARISASDDLNNRLIPFYATPSGAAVYQMYALAARGPAASPPSHLLRIATCLQVL